MLLITHLPVILNNESGLTSKIRIWAEKETCTKMSLSHSSFLFRYSSKENLGQGLSKVLGENGRRRWWRQELIVFAVHEAQTVFRERNRTENSFSVSNRETVSLFLRFYFLKLFDKNIMWIKKKLSLQLIAGYEIWGPPNSTCSSHSILQCRAATLGVSGVYLCCITWFAPTALAFLGLTNPGITTASTAVTQGVHTVSLDGHWSGCITYSTPEDIICIMQIVKVK